MPKLYVGHHGSSRSPPKRSDNHQEPRILRTKRYALKHREGICKAQANVCVSANNTFSKTRSFSAFDEHLSVLEMKDPIRVMKIQNNTVCADTLEFHCPCARFPVDGTRVDFSRVILQFHFRRVISVQHNSHSRLTHVVWCFVYCVVVSCDITSCVMRAIPMSNVEDVLAVIQLWRIVSVLGLTLDMFPFLILVTWHARPHVYFASRGQPLPRVQAIPIIVPELLGAIVERPHLPFIAWLTRPHPHRSSIHRFARVQTDAIVAFQGSELLALLVSEVPMLVSVLIGS